MKCRRHHNTKGLRQIKRGNTRKQVERMARRLGIPYAKPDQEGSVVDGKGKVQK
jgi:hypothetical protein